MLCAGCSTWNISGFTPDEKDSLIGIRQRKWLGPSHWSKLGHERRNQIFCNEKNEIALGCHFLDCFTAGFPHLVDGAKGDRVKFLP